MKRLFIILPIFLIFQLCCSGQANKQKQFLQVLESLFPHYEKQTIKSQEVFETKVWDKHATIPLNYCDIVNLEDGISAVAFSIYLSDYPEDYKIMIEEELITEDQIGEDSEFNGGGERLIQVIFYNFTEDKFIGKPEDFPISGLLWIPKVMNIPLEHTYVESFTKSNKCKNTCILTMAEYSDMYPVKLYCVFKYHNNKILSSELFRGWLNSIYEKDNRLIAKMNENYHETEEYEKVLINFID